MATVTVRELRNQGGRVLDRVEAGDRVTVTRNGRPVAELVPVVRRLTSAEIVEQVQGREAIDPERLRDDAHDLFDWRLLHDG
jgi:prevent-host-death family protein